MTASKSKPQKSPAPARPPARGGSRRSSATSTLYGADGEIKAQWVKEGAQSRAERVLSAAERVREVRPAKRSRMPRRRGTRTDLCAVYPLGDPHIGLRAEADASCGGAAQYGTREACRLFRHAMGDLVRRGPRTEHAVIASMGDFFHSDDPSNRTRRHGHALDVDGAWDGILREGVEMLRDLVDIALGHHRTVHVKCVIGNHDDLSSVFLAMWLEAYYRNEPRVIVDTSADPFLWHTFGRVMLGFTHGHECAPKDLPAVMAARAGWALALHRHWLLGHVHHTRRVEIGGCTIESFRTLAPRDAWANGKGYICGRDLSRIVFHREHGEVSREIFNVSEVCL